MPGQAEANEIRVVTRTGGDGRAVIEVRDTGPGIPPDLKNQLFTPFFTTKPIGTGTGLGLSICHRIVSALGGEIEVESELGKGAVFRVLLRPTPAEAIEPLPAPPDQSPLPRRGHILIIDDEVIVARAVARILTAQHDVVIAPGAVAALDRIRAGERYDLILCDLMMPDVTGMDFYVQLRALVPELAEEIVFVTGGAFTPKARAFLDGVPNARLEKPFDVQNLRALIRDRLR
jgi:CheY-like chemotaxis protein